MSVFCASLGEVLSAKGINLRAFSRLISTNSGLVYQVFQGTKPVPLEHLDKWLSVLELPERQRRALEKQALREYAPPYLWKVINENDVRLKKWIAIVADSARKAGIKLDPLPDFFGEMPSHAPQKSPRSKPTT